MNMRACLVALIVMCVPVAADFADLVKGVRTYLWRDEDVSTEVGEEFARSVPYELSAVDEKFIAEATKLTGVALSQLDTCQQAVVLKLQTDCDRMNDEMVAKMAVALLNCQSYVEGRRVYPCTIAMSIKDCTTSMDSDTWNSYHLMTNRVKAVCYSVRQVHFRGLTEQTINRLMDTSRSQLKSLGEISKQQEDLKDIASDTITALEKGNTDLLEQHKDLQKAQFFGQLAIEDNINRLVDEKRMIMESQTELSELSQQMRSKLHEATQQLQLQAKERASNHQEIVDDLIAIQNQANIIFQRIEDSSKLLLEQTATAQKHYHDTLAQLAEVNTTMTAIVAMVSDSRQAIDARLAWLSESLGGANVSLARLQAIAVHIGILLLGMVLCAFLSAQFSTRIMMLMAVSGNLAMLMFSMESLGIVELIGSIFVGTFVLNVFSYLTKRLMHTTKKAEAIQVNGNCSTPVRTSSEKYVHTSVSSNSRYETNDYTPPSEEGNGDYAPPSEAAFYSPRSFRSALNDTIHEDVTDCEYAAPTPPVSRNGHYAGSRGRSRTPSIMGDGGNSCQGVTRAGTPCKQKPSKSSLYCFRHQRGDSVLQ